MKKIGLLFVICCMLFSVAHLTVAHAGNSAVKQAYMFGFAASFTDSVVHFTEIQQLDSVYFDSKTKFLKRRDAYSNQLRDYLAQKQNMPHRTCIVIYGDNRKKLEKKYLKMRRKYSSSQRNNFDIRTLTPADFSFRQFKIEE